jgi:hypothetical protein
MKVVTHSLDSVTLYTTTLFQKTWLIEYSAKGEQGNLAIRGVLVRREIIYVFVEDVLARNATE